MALLSRFLGRTASEGAAFALGAATGPVLAPAVEEVKNEAWKTHASRRLSAGEAAEIVAEDVEKQQWGRDEAIRHGVAEDRFDALVDAVRNAPGFAQLLAVYRRGLIGDDAFRHGLRKMRLEELWDVPLAALKQQLLSPAELANARQQGFVTPRRQKDEAELQGVNDDRAEIQFELAGLPPGAMDALVLLRRKIIDEDTYRQIVREGRTKVKYTDDLLALREHILTATDAANLWLKGWISEAEAKRIGALNGYDAATMDRLYENRGRPATVRQAHIGYARGGRLPGAASEDATLDRAIKESNIRSEWADILKAQRYTYPSAFVLRALASDGTFSPALTEKILTESGWKPEWSKLAAQKWAASAGGAGGAQKWGDRARTRLFTVTHNEYLEESIDAAKVRDNLTTIGVAAAEQDDVLRLWNAEAGIYRRELTAAEIRKAYHNAAPEYPRQVAIDELIERGMTLDDAVTFLDYSAEKG